MITPGLMELLSFVVLRDKVEEVSARLLKLNSFHPVDIRNIEDKIKGLSSAQIDKESQTLEALQTRIRDITRKLKIVPVLSYEKDIQGSSLPGIEQLLSALEKEIAPFLDSKSQLQDELSTNQSILVQVREYLPFNLQSSSFYSFLDVSTGKIEEKNIAVLERSLQGVPHVIYPFGKENSWAKALLIGLRRDKALIDKVLSDVAWEEMDFSRDSEHLSKEAQKELSRKIEEGKLKILEVEKQISQIGLRQQDDLARAKSFIGLKKSLLEAQRFSCLTEKTALFSGWVPQDEKSRVITEIKAIGEVSYIESKPPEELEISKEDIPVRFQHGALVKPFELLIDAYGIPRYGTIDPTIFVAFSFLVMFGAMFGDIGHGSLLAILGLFLAFKTSRGLSINRQMGILLFYCGVSSGIFGVFYGSAFGFEFESLWLKPMNDIMGIFRAGILLGIVIITLGIIINVVNSFRDRDYAKAIFDKAGLIGGMVYWAAIGLVSKIFFAQGQIPPVYSYLIFSGLLILFLYPIIDSLFIRKHGGFFESLMESVVNILEIFMGYLSNTVSFIRVAAFALAHAGLFLAIFTLSRLTDNHTGMGNMISWLIIIAGNILVVCLEGLIVSIQALRLNYYEFFSKFFISGKQMYKPLSSIEKG